MRFLFAFLLLANIRSTICLSIPSDDFVTDLERRDLQGDKVSARSTEIQPEKRFLNFLVILVVGATSVVMGVRFLVGGRAPNSRARLEALAAATIYDYDSDPPEYYSGSSRSPSPPPPYDSPAYHPKLKGRSIPGIRKEMHVPIANGTSFHHAIKAMHNSSESFLHVSSTWTNGSLTSHQYYRRAHKDDLGHENDGSYHHMRSTEAGSIAKRDEERGSNGLVVDYLWKDPSASVAHDLNNNFGQNAYYGGIETGGWMWDNSVLATCATLVEEYRPSGGAASNGDANKGVMAYGWNGSPFGFNGRSSGWIDSCCDGC